jgi:LytR cell envelope-related transcriptional attenuator
MSDPTDPGGVGAAQAERASRGNRLGDSGSPVGSPLTIILAVIAVVAGFLIFRTLDSDSNAGADGDPGAIELTTTTTTAAGQAAGTTVAPGGTTTTSFVPQRTGGTVLVANASQVPGSAGRMTQTLDNAGYDVVEPATNADKSQVEVPISKTIVYYSVGVDMNFVNTLSRDLGSATVMPMPSTIPVTGNTLGAATVLVMLGTDMADKPLSPTLASPSAPAAAANTTTTAAA